MSKHYEFVFLWSSPFLNNCLYRKRFLGINVLDKPIYYQMTLFEIKLVLSKAEWVGIC